MITWTETRVHDDDRVCIVVHSHIDFPENHYVTRHNKGKQPLPQPQLLIEKDNVHHTKTAFFNSIEEAFNASLLLVPEKYRWL